MKTTLLIGLWVGSPGWSAARQNGPAPAPAVVALGGGAGVENRRRMILEDAPLGVRGKVANGQRDPAIDAGRQRLNEQRNLLMLAADATPQPSASAKTSPPEANVPAKHAASKTAADMAVPAPRGGAPAATAQQPTTSDAKSQSILQMIEGHESEVKRGLIIAAAAFVLGWLCGGGFYARRERKMRHKLRF